MPKKYKHIKLPKQLINPESSHIPHPGRPFDDFSGIDFAVQRKSLAHGVIELEKFITAKRRSVSLDADRDLDELEIKFHGSYSPKIVDKYRIKVYKKDIDEDENSVIYGRISNKKLSSTTKSDFERLRDDVLTYQETDRFRSFFQKVKEVKPLTFDQIIEKNLKAELESDPTKEVMVDISFADDGLVATRLAELQREYGDKFFSKVDSNLVHFCRVRANLSEIQDTASKMGGILDIEHGPIYDLRTSSLEETVEHMEVLAPSENTLPIFMFDGAVNDTHFIVNGAVIENRKSLDIHLDHGTAVASLMICGSDIMPGAPVIQKNKVIAINYFEDRNNAEANLKRYVEEFATNHSILIINFSINNYYLYEKAKIDKLTVLLDELATEHNCLFIISAGNLFQPRDPDHPHRYWSQTMTDLCLKKGYPDYFELACTRVVPPADSINNISVGSVAYQESVNSLARIKHPTPITRGNLDKNIFIKPDLVHFDSNITKEYVVENNGVYMASDKQGSLARKAGTSFATPLVTHAAGLLRNYYPDYKVNSIKALLLHFAERLEIEAITDENIKQRMVGFGIPNVSAALNSFNSSSCIVIEDEIGVNKKKRVRFPIPACITGDRQKRLRIRKTLVYNPKVNPSDMRNYSPLNITVQMVREDEQEVGTSASRDAYDGAHKKSNVKRYLPQEISTLKHTGAFWFLDVICESRGDSLPADYKQPYSIILSIEDMKADDSLDLHEEINNMIEIETQVEVSIDVT